METDDDPKPVEKKGVISKVFYFEQGGFFCLVPYFLSFSQVCRLQ